MSRSERLQELHNRGQEEGAKNDYNPPRGEVEQWFKASYVQKEMREENAAYKAGWENGYDQR